MCISRHQMCISRHQMSISRHQMSISRHQMSISRNLMLSREHVLQSVCSTHTIVYSPLRLTRVPSHSHTPFDSHVLRFLCFVFLSIATYFISRLESVWDLCTCVSFGHTTSRGTSSFDIRILSLPPRVENYYFSPCFQSTVVTGTLCIWQ